MKIRSFPALLLGMGISASVMLAAMLAAHPVTALADGNETTFPADLSLAAEGEDARRFVVPLYKSGLIRTSKPISRISVGNPGIADIVVLRNNEVHVVGKALGSTDLVLWDRSNQVFDNYSVEVIHDLETLKFKLHQLLPGENIKVHSAQENIVISGEVSNLARMQAAKSLAESFLPECVTGSSTTTTEKGQTKSVETLPGAGSGQACKKGEVVNLLQVGGAQQVMLKVTVAEVARTVLKKLETDLSIMNLGSDISSGLSQGGATFPNTPTLVPVDNLGGTSPIGGPLPQAIDAFNPNGPTIDSSGIFLSYLEGDLFLQAVLDIQRRKGLAQILSEPTLTTLSGQNAEFLSGGEFPVPVPQDEGTITIEFKEFGVGVKFLPVVMDSGRINLKLNINVSELSGDNNVVIQGIGTANAFVVPSLTKRSTINTVELANGQTIGLAGLINDNTREFVDKLPGLGDLPILGALFRSQEFRSGQTELVIFVTPHLAKPIAPELVRLPTDSFVPPSDTDFYLFGRMESADGPAPRPVSGGRKGGTDGARFGHDL